MSTSDTIKSAAPTLTRSWKPIAAATILFVLFTAVLLSGLRWKVGTSQSTSIENTAIEQQSTFQQNRLLPELHIYRKPSTIRQRWRITTGLRRPDGVSKRVYLVNDVFPGPNVECRSGDRLTIEVENGLDNEELSIHWHGLSMNGFNDMDGAIGITNMPIKPGESFTYDFQVEDSQSGTFWYHSHHQNQRADGLYGALIVHKPRSRGHQTLDSEYILMLGDWYHRSAEDALRFYSHPGSFGNEAVPDSMLVNGKGTFNCSDAVPARPLDCQMLSPTNISAVLTLDSGKRNIVRVVNVGSYAGIGLSGLHFEPFAVDGGNQIAGRPARSLRYLHPGERVDVVVESSTISTESVLEVTLDTSQFKYPNPALTPTHAFPVHWIGSGGTTAPFEDVADTLDLQMLRAANNINGQFPPFADQVIILYAKTMRLAHLENEPRGFLNHTSWKPQAMPPLPLRELSRHAWDENQFVPQIAHNAKKPLWVDIVLNNLDEESHPFHLHGYDYWVLSTYSSSYNWGSYNPFEDDEPPGGLYNLVDPVKKDTVLVPRRGYAVLRFKADNPGIWMFHCHVLWHQSSGMSMAFEVG